MSIDIRNVNKRFGNFVALNDVNLTVETGELVALLGPSGCGKTTLLRIIAGFVFQHYALFRHMTVFENVAFGLRVKPRKERPSEAAIRQKVHNLLELVQLDWLAERYPSQLSGGQRQRIALARALAVEPRLLLLDEPFGALDAKVRKDLRRWLRRLHDEIHVTSVFVTHDQEEALEVADRIVVLNKGRIEQVGSPDEVYSAPASPFVYSFLGNVNLFHGRVAEGWADIGGLRVPAGDHAEADGAAAVAYVRPHDIELSREALEQSLEGSVAEVRLLGGLVRLVLTHGAEEVEVELSREAYLRETVQPGERVYFRPRQARVFLAPDEAGADYRI